MYWKDGQHNGTHAMHGARKTFQ